MGTPRNNIQPEFMGSEVPCEEAQHPRERFACGHISGYQRKVPPYFLCSWAGADPYSLKVHDVASPVQ